MLGSGWGGASADRSLAPVRVGIRKPTLNSPIIGIAVDADDIDGCRRYTLATAYVDAVRGADAVPVLLTHDMELAETYVRWCDGIVLTGGVDPRMETFGVPTAADARPMDARRQAFDLALLAAADRRPELPLLAICLGMQLMALHRGGTLNQSLARTHPTADRHADNRCHPVLVRGGCTLAAAERPGEQVVSNHRQAVEKAGDLQIVAVSDDEVIEAVEDPRRPFCCGVQWHPERGGEGPLNAGLFLRMVEAARSSAVASTARLAT